MGNYGRNGDLSRKMVMISPATERRNMELATVIAFNKYN